MRFYKNILQIINEKTKNIISPRQSNEDKRRSELILNILLFSSILFLLIINIIRTIDWLKQGPDRGLPLEISLLILGLFIFLLVLSKKGKTKSAAVIFIASYALPTIYFACHWGADLPAVLLLSVLIIIFSGVLISARFAWINSAIIGAFLLLIAELQGRSIIKINSYWRLEKNELADMFSYLIILGVIATVSWLYAREIEKSLYRARRSEQDLQKERDLLEIKVEERTKQIHELEMEKISQLYRLAEFGRLSSGIFHDLINPLTAVGLSLEQLSQENNLKTNNHLEQAFRATRKMESFIVSIKKQIKGEKIKKYFWLKQEIQEVQQILQHKIIKSGVEIKIETDPTLQLYGDPLKFNQIIANLLSNAIEACCQTKSGQIKLQAYKQNEEILIFIEDNGQGIKKEYQEKIWQTFFSTKNQADCGLGIGLASVKNIVEKDFKGTIELISSAPGKTIFKISLPCQHEKDNNQSK